MTKIVKCYANNFKNLLFLSFAQLISIKIVCYNDNLIPIPTQISVFDLIDIK